MGRDGGSILGSLDLGFLAQLKKKKKKKAMEICILSYLENQKNNR